MINLSVVTLLCFIKPDYPKRIINLKMTCLWFGVTYIADQTFRFFKHHTRFDCTENFENHSSFWCVNTVQAHIWRCVMLCAVVQLFGKHAHFDTRSCINHQSCLRTVALCRVKLCSYRGKHVHFDVFSCIVHPQSCLRRLCHTVLCFEADISYSTLKYMRNFKHSHDSRSLP